MQQMLNTVCLRPATGTNYAVIEAMMINYERQPTCWTEDGRATIMHLYLSCARTLQSLFMPIERR